MAGPALDTSPRASSGPDGAKPTEAPAQVSAGLEVKLPELTAEKLLGPLENATKQAAQPTTHAELRHNNQEGPQANGAVASNQPAAATSTVTRVGGQSPNLHDQGFTPWPVTKKRSTGYPDLDELLERRPQLATAVANFEALLDQLRQAQRNQTESSVSKNTINNALQDIARELKGDLVADLVISSAQVKQLGEHLARKVAQVQEEGAAPEWLPELIRVNLAPNLVEAIAGKLQVEAKVAEARLARARKLAQEQPAVTPVAPVVPEIPKTSRENHELVKKTEEAAAAVEGATRAVELRRERERDDAREKQREAQRVQELERVQNLLKRWRELETRQTEAELLKSKHRVEELGKELKKVEMQLDRELAARPELRALIEQHKTETQFALETGRQKLLAALDKLKSEFDSTLYTSDSTVVSVLRDIPESQRHLVRFAYQANHGTSLNEQLKEGLSKDNLAEAKSLLADSPRSKNEWLDREVLDIDWGAKDLDLTRATAALTKDLDRADSSPDQVRKEELQAIAKALGLATDPAERESLQTELSAKLSEMRLGEVQRRELVESLGLTQLINFGVFEERAQEFRAVAERISYLSASYDASKGDPEAARQKILRLQRESEEEREQIRQQVMNHYGADPQVAAALNAELDRIDTQARDAGKERFARVQAIAPELNSMKKEELFDRLKGLSPDELKLLDQRVRHHHDGIGLRAFGLEEYSGIDQKQFLALIEGRSAEAIAGELAQALKAEDRDQVLAILNQITEEDARKGEGVTTLRDSVLSTFDSQYAGAFLLRTEREHVGFSGTRDVYRYTNIYATSFAQVVGKQFGVDTEEASAITAAQKGDPTLAIAYQLHTDLTSFWDSKAVSAVERLEAIRDPKSGELDIARLEAINKAFAQASHGKDLRAFLEERALSKAGERELGDRGLIANWGLAVIEATRVRGSETERREKLEALDARAAAFKVLYSTKGAGTKEGMLARATEAPQPLVQEIQRLEADPNATDAQRAELQARIDRRLERISSELKVTSGYTLNEWVKSELSERAARVQQATMRAGYENDGLKLARLMGGNWDGTENEKEIRRILEKNHAQGSVERLEKQFAAISDIALLPKLRTELGGDDRFVAEMSCVELNPEIRKLSGAERHEAAIKQRISLVETHLNSSVSYEYRDNPVAWATPGTSAMALFEMFTGSMTSAERKAWEEELARAKNELKTVAELRDRREDISSRLAYLNIANSGVHQSGIAYVDARAIAGETIGDNVKMVVMTGGTVVTVVLTGGLTGGVVIVALKVGAVSAGAAVVGNAAGFTTKAIISGDSAWTNWDKDLAEAGADAAVQGVLGAALATPTFGLGSQAARAVDGFVGKGIAARTGGGVFTETGERVIERGVGTIAKEAIAESSQVAGSATARAAAAETGEQGIKALSGEMLEQATGKAASQAANQLAGRVAAEGIEQTATASATMAGKTATNALKEGAETGSTGWFKRMTESATFKRAESFLSREWQINQRLAPYAQLTEAGGFAGNLSRQAGNHLLSTGPIDAITTKVGTAVYRRFLTKEGLGHIAARMPGQIVQGSIDGAISGMGAGMVMRGVDNFDLAKDGNLAGWLDAMRSGLLSDAQMGALFGAAFAGVTTVFHTPASVKRGRVLKDEVARNACENKKFGEAGQRFLKDTYASKGYLNRGDLELATLGRKPASRAEVDTFLKEMGIEKNPDVAKALADPAQKPAIPEVDFYKLSPLELRLLQERAGKFKRPDSATALTPDNVKGMMADAQAQLRRRDLSPEARKIEQRRYESLQSLDEQFRELDNTIFAQASDVTVKPTRAQGDKMPPEARRRYAKEPSSREQSMQSEAAATKNNLARTASGHEIVADAAPISESVVARAETRAALKADKVSEGGVESSQARQLAADRSVAAQLEAAPAKAVDTTKQSTNTFDETTELGRTQRACADLEEIIVALEKDRKPADTFKRLLADQRAQLARLNAELRPATRAASDNHGFSEGGGTGSDRPSGGSGGGRDGGLGISRSAGTLPSAAPTGASRVSFDTLKVDVAGTRSSARSAVEPTNMQARVGESAAPEQAPLDATVTVLEPDLAPSTQRQARELSLEDQIAESAGSRRFENELHKQREGASNNLKDGEIEDIFARSIEQFSDNSAPVKGAERASNTVATQPEYIDINGTRIERTEAIRKAEKEVAALEASVKRAQDARRSTESLRALRDEAGENLARLYQAALGAQGKSGVAGVTQSGAQASKGSDGVVRLAGKSATGAGDTNIPVGSSRAAADPLGDFFASQNGTPISFVDDSARVLVRDGWQSDPSKKIPDVSSAREYTARRQTQASAAPFRSPTEFAEPLKFTVDMPFLRQADLVVAEPQVGTQTIFDPRTNPDVAFDPRTSSASAFDPRTNTNVAGMKRLFSEPHLSRETTTVLRPEPAPHPQPKPQPQPERVATKQRTAVMQDEPEQKSRRVPPSGPGQSSTFVMTLTRRPGETSQYSEAIKKLVEKSGAARTHGRRTRLKVNELGVIMAESSGDDFGNPFASAEERLWDQGPRSVLADRDT